MSQILSNTDYLLVPMNVQAALVNQAVANTIWSRGKMDFTQLSNFNPASPGPFSGMNEDIALGIHLLWELPAAFRHGMHDPNSDAPPSYPMAPNRWLVARFWPGGTSSPRQCKAWILNSDATTSGTSPFVNPSAQNGDSWDTKFGTSANGGYQVGAVTSIDSWTNPDPAADLFLQALGPGSVTFSAFSPNVENVFSMVDDATDNSGNALITDTAYVITSASNSSIVIESENPSSLSGIFHTGVQLVLYHQGGWYGAYTVHSGSPGTTNFTITTTAPLDPQAEGNSGIVIPVQDQQAVQSTTADSFTISSNIDLSPQFPQDSFFYVTGSAKNNNSYQVVATSYNATTQVFTLVVGGSGGTIVQAGATDGQIWSDGSNEFVNFDYLVLGWYSSVTGDPLQQAGTLADWAALLSGMNWMTNPGPYPVSTIHINQYAETSDILVSGLGDLTAQFPAGSTISVIGSQGCQQSYTLGSGDAAPSYNKTTGTTVLSITTVAIAPAPGEQVFVLPASLSGQNFPLNTLVHGQLNNVTWQTGVQPARPNCTEQKINQNVRVAVGNSGIDALSAAFVSQQQNDLNVGSITGAQAYPGTIQETNAPITLTGISSDLTDQWFPAGSSIVLTQPSGMPIGTFRVASTLFNAGTSTVYIYLATPFTPPAQGSYPYSLVVTPSYLDAELIEAFQTNKLAILEEPGGRTKLDIALRKETFRPQGGGTLWKLQPISGKPIFKFAIAGVNTGASPGFTLDTSLYSASTKTQLDNLFATNCPFTVSGTKGSSPAGSYVVLSTSSTANTFTIVTTTTPLTTSFGPTNAISIASLQSVLPIRFDLFNVVNDPSPGFVVQSSVDLSMRLPAGSGFTVTGPAASVAGTYTVANVDYSNAPRFIIYTTEAPGNPTFSSANKIELDNATLVQARAQWLADIQILQNNLDRETRVLRSLQSECYARWWQTNNLSLNSLPNAITQTQLTGMQNTLGNSETDVVNQMATVYAWQSMLQSCIAGLNFDTSLITSEIRPELNAYWELKATEGPRFYQPNDPVVLISGLDSSFDIANSASPNAPLLCRFSVQVATSLTVAGTAITTDMLTNDLAAPSNSQLPAALNTLISSLSFEALFLNTGSVQLLAQVGNVASQQVAMTIEQQTGYENSAGAAAVLPIPLAVQQWQQAWMPLYLDWNINWHATEAATAINQVEGWEGWFFDKGAWSFDGTDYQFTHALPTEQFAFTYNSGPQNLSLQTSDKNLYLSSLIENNTLQDIEETPYPITSAMYAGGTLTITLQNNPVTRNQNFSFQFTVGRKGFPLTTDPGTMGSFTVQATYDEYKRFQASNQSVFIYHNSTTYDTYTISSVAYSINTQLLTLNVSGNISDYSAGDNLYLVVTYTPPAAFSGRTFVTPEATFNFRSRLQQYIQAHSGTCTTEHLQEVEHILDIIGGQDFPIVEAGMNEFVIASSVELNHLFPVGSTCYVSQSPGVNNGAYTVSEPVTLSGGYVTVPVHETVQDSPLGILTPAPHRWDLMSQTLSGFTDQLVMRSQEANVSPGGCPAIKPLTGGSSTGNNYTLSGYTPPPNQFTTIATFQVAVSTDISGQYPSGSSFIITQTGTGNLGGIYINSANATYSGGILTLSFDTSNVSNPTIPGFPVYTGCDLQTGPAPGSQVLSAVNFADAPWYALGTGSAAPGTLCFNSAEDVSYLFPVNQSCYFADANSTKPYSVSPLQVTGTTFAAGLMTITVEGTLTGTPSGFVGPDMNTLIGGYHAGFPIISNADNSDATSAAWYFPIRGGFFEFTQLQIVDRFGQVADLLLANNNAVSMANEQDIANVWKTFAPIKSRWLTPAPDCAMPNTNNRLSKLAPRIVTPARLDFCFVDGSGGANDKIDIGLLPDAEPVCGWLLPNYIDGGISVYDHKGLLLGELVLSAIPDKPAQLVWYTAGGIQSMSLSQLTATQIPNPYLLAMLIGLGNRPTDIVGLAFQNLLQAIDETLWTIDDTNQSDQSMAVLLGRPLALVRARLKFTLSAHPDYDQASQYYTYTNRFTTWSPTQATSTSPACFTITNTTSTDASEVTELAAQFTPNQTLSVNGQTDNAGTYQIINASGTFNNPGYTLQVNVVENMASANTEGVLQLNPPAGGVTELKWPVRLGLANLYDDGLIGYYQDGDGYLQFNSVHIPEDLDSADYLYPIGAEGENYLKLRFQAETSHGAPGGTPPDACPEPGSTFVTLLMDPRATVHATCGLLPAKSLQMPQTLTKHALENMAVTFRVGPLLTGANNIQLPLPNALQGQWSWQEIQSGSETMITKAVAHSGQTAQLPEAPLILQDGWLSLQKFD